jgi:hypothetical protein
MMQITGCCVLAARSSEERSGVLSLTGDVRAGGGDAWRSPRLVLSSRVAPRIGEELGVGMSFTSHANLRDGKRGIEAVQSPNHMTEKYAI